MNTEKRDHYQKSLQDELAIKTLKLNVMDVE